MPFRQSITSRALAAFVSITVSASASGCLDAADEPPDDEVPIATTAQALTGSETSLSNFADKLGMSKEVQAAFSGASQALAGIASIYSGVAAAGMIMQFIGGGASFESKVEASLDHIKRQLDLLVRLSHEGVNSEVNGRLAGARGAIQNAKGQLQAWTLEIERNEPPPPNNGRDATIAALITSNFALLDPDYTKRLYDENAIEGLWMNMTNDRAARPGELVWDHQTALPTAIAGIELRLLWMSNQNRNFHLNAAFADELRRYEAAIRVAMQRMESNVRCKAPATSAEVITGAYLAGCADIATGISFVKQLYFWDMGHPITLDAASISAHIARFNAHAQQVVHDAMGLDELLALRWGLLAAATAIDPVILTGRFDRDHRTDVALVGAGDQTTIPLAISLGDGRFDVRNSVPAANDPIREFVAWSLPPQVKTAAGDFDGDGVTDIALAGGAGWSNIKVAFSRGDGTFRITNATNYGEDGLRDLFSVWAAQPGAKLVSGDFNNDGRDDLALAGGVGWNTVPTALSLGESGSFYVRNSWSSQFATWAAQAGAKVFAGEFGDGSDDLALAGGTSWGTIPLAILPDGPATVPMDPVTVNNTTSPVSMMSGPVAGDFDGDGLTDMAFIGAHDLKVEVVTSRGYWFLWNEWRVGKRDFPVQQLPGWSRQDCVRTLSGDFDGNGKDDIGLLGNPTWGSLPVGFSNGTSFATTNHGIGGFARWAACDGKRR